MNALLVTTRYINSIYNDRNEIIMYLFEIDRFRENIFYDVKKNSFQINHLTIVSILPTIVDENSNPYSFILKPVKNYKIFKHINTMKKSTSNSHDTISNNILNFFCKYLLLFIKHMINSSFMCWKFSTIF